MRDAAEVLVQIVTADEAAGEPHAAVFNLNQPAHVVHWSFIDLPISNVIAIAVLVVVFVLAIVIPFPRAAKRAAARRAGSES